MVGHLIDAERVFGFRALVFARGERAPFPGFDEEEYVAEAAFEERTLGDLLAELDTVRQGHLFLFRGLRPAAWLRRGTASGSPVSVRALAAIMVGHLRHHLAVVRERYRPHLAR